MRSNASRRTLSFSAMGVQGGACHTLLLRVNGLVGQDLELERNRFEWIR